MNRKSAKNLLLISFAAETFFATYGLLLGSDASVVSILFCIAGLLFIYAVLFLDEARLAGAVKSETGSRWIKSGLLVTMLILAFITGRYWINQIAIDPDYADMLPVIKVMNERFLGGHWNQIYQPVPDISPGLMPGYLPAMWLPYAGAIWLNLDMRWVTVLALLLSFGMILFLFRIRRKSVPTYLIASLTAMLFWWIFSRDDFHGVISMSEEGPVILYYVLLCIAITSRNTVCIAVSASLCLLSRYSLIGWIIPLLIFLLAGKQYRRILIFSATGLFIFLAFFLIPFGAEPVWQLFHLPAIYVAFASKVWTATPEVFWLNLGLAKFFGPHRTLLLHRVLIWGTFLIPALFMLICLLQKKRRLNNILLATLKLSLLIFYQFIDVPFGYLFYTPVFVSLAITVILFRQERPEAAVYQSPDSSMP